MRRTGGFTLVEIVVSLAIALILAAAFLPGLIGGVDRARVDESAESLSALGDAIGSMRRDVGRYPGRLSQLSSPIGMADTDACGTPYGAAAASWAGPYLNRAVGAAGMPLPLGTARDLMSYTATPPLLRIHVENVDEADARALQRKVDADDDPAGGAVRWGAVSGSGLVELLYVRPVRTC